MNSKLEAKLQDSAYRTAFVASQINIGIPFQVKGLMKARGWTQERLAERTGMLQPRISAILKPGKVRPNIETLRRLAEAFDCGLLVKFVSFSELARWSDSFDPDNFNVPQFLDDRGFRESESVAVTTRDRELMGLGNLSPDDSDLLRRIKSAWAVEVAKAVQAYPEGLHGLANSYNVETSKFSEPVTTSSWPLRTVPRDPSQRWQVSREAVASRKGVEYSTVPIVQERAA